MSRSSPHIWGMYSWHRTHYTKHSYPWVHPAVQEARRRADNRAHWKSMAVSSIGDRASMTTDLRGAWGRSFRLVDGHGCQYGPRYTCQETRSSADWNAKEHLVTDSRGRQHWMSIRQRVRIVDAQPEDLNSQLSRMLKAAHKRSLA